MDGKSGPDLEREWGVDLFGDPIPARRDGPGRPRFEWTLENSNKIKLLLALGWSNERIAATVLDPRTGKPISVPTLKRHFRAELKVRTTAADRLMARRVEVLAKQALEDGNVGAHRLLDKMLEQEGLKGLGRKIAQRQTAAQPPAQTEGKKARADRAAAAPADPDSPWGDDLDWTGSRVQ